MTTKKQIALLLYPGMVAFDIVGPMQVLAELPRFAPEYEVVVVSERVEPVDTDLRAKLVPDKAFDDVPAPDIFIVPGGSHATLQQMYYPPMREYIRQIASTAEIIGSVCTGSLILASVGLLEGRTATTHWGYVRILERFGARYVRKRWVEDGNIITGAGVSAGIDYALHLVERLAGPDIARKIQLSLEYDPQPPHEHLNYRKVGPMMRMIQLSALVMGHIAANKAIKLNTEGA
ncbi:MAG: DJ-1/PfpI family protein [Chloroflexi bacterium]|nr:MAG: DJ-1/PfpI family protein [Chloroflexota bacterium]